MEHKMKSSAPRWHLTFPLLYFDNGVHLTRMDNWQFPTVPKMVTQDEGVTTCCRVHSRMTEIRWNAFLLALIEKGKADHLPGNRSIASVDNRPNKYPPA
jgi:hypothetical protein